MPERQLTSAKKVQENAQNRRKEQRGRIDAYESFLKAYFAESEAVPQQNSNADGRPALRSFSPGQSERRASPNYIKPIVKDLVAIAGAWPTVTVPPASSEQGDRDRAVLITRALREQHDHSAMSEQQKSGGFFLKCLGDCCYVLDVRTPEDYKQDQDPFRPVGIYYTVINPKQAFPKFRMNLGQRDLDDLYVISQMSREDARSTYPSAGISLEGEPQVDVIHFYSRQERQTVVDGKRAFGVVHGLGFCPAEWVSNEATDGRWAQADIAGAIDLHDELQAIYKVVVDTLIAAAYPIIHIHDADQTSGQVELGPGAQFVTRGTGSINLLAPVASPQAAIVIFDLARDNLMQQAGIAPIRLEGQIDRSNVSARSVDRQQGPMEQRLKMTMELLGTGLQRLNAKCLLMLSKVEPLKTAEMELYGEDQDGVFRLTFTGEDVGGWQRNRVKWDSMTGSTQQERTVRALQLYKEGQGEFPFSMVLSESGFEDPKAVMDEGRAESQRRMQEQQQMQAQMQPQGQPQGGPPGDAAQQQMSLAAGGSGGQTPPPPVQPPPGAGQNGNGQMPGFPPTAAPPAQSGMGSPAPVPDLAAQMQQAQQTLTALKLNGDFQVVVRSSGPVVELSDVRDASRVRYALRAAGIDFAVVSTQQAQR